MRIPHLEWQTVVVLVAFVAAAVVVWTVAPDHRGDILATLAVVGPAVLSLMRPMLGGGPPTSGAGGGGVARVPAAPTPDAEHERRIDERVRGGSMLPLVLALVLAPALTGCGASALRTHATIGTVAAVTLGGAAPLVAPACDAALTACQREPSCLTETAERCRVASAAVDGLSIATRGYLDAIEVASMADEGATLPALMTGLSRLVVRWGEVVALLDRFGVELPALPALASSLLSGGAL